MLEKHVFYLKLCVSNYLLLLTSILTLNPLPTQLQAQAPNPSTIYTTTIPHGYSLFAFGGSGFQPSTRFTATDISYGNPAVLSDIDHYWFGISYSFENQLDPAWLQEISHERLSGYLPQSAGVVLPLMNMRIGIAFSQAFNSKIQFEPVQISTIDDPDGTGEYFNTGNEILINRYNVAISRDFDIVADLVQLNAGVQSSIDQLHYDSYIWKTKVKANGLGASWKIGTRLTLFKQHQVGAYYDTGIRIKTKAEESSEILFDGSDPDSLENIIFKEEWDVRAELPARLHFGIYSRFGSFGLSAEGAKIFWDGLQENWSNSNLFAGNINYFYKDYLYTSLGILSVTSHLTGTALFGEDIESNLHSIYLFTGFGVKFGNRYTVDFAFADGESYSGKWRKGNMINISVSIEIL